MCFGIRVEFSTNEGPGKPCRLSLAFVSHIHTLWAKIKTQNKVWTSSPSDTSKWALKEAHALSTKRFIYHNKQALLSCQPGVIEGA